MAKKADQHHYSLRSNKLPGIALGGAAGVVWALIEVGANLGKYGLIAILLLVPALLIAHALTRKSVDVGLDGVLIRSRMSKRFVPHEDIAELENLDPVKKGARKLRIVLEDGETIELDTDHHKSERDNSNAATIVKDIKRAQKRRKKKRAEAVACVTRNADSGAAAWLEALRGLAQGKSAYRQRVVTSDDLSAVLDDPAAPLKARVGAAVALEQLDRLRVVAEGVADPAERSTMLRIADAPSDRLEPELEALLEDELSRSNA